MNCGHASAQQLERASLDSDVGSMHLVNNVAEVLEQREVRRVFDKAPHVPVAGNSAVSMYDG